MSGSARAAGHLSRLAGGAGARWVLLEPRGVRSRPSSPSLSAQRPLAAVLRARFPARVVQPLLCRPGSGCAIRAFFSAIPGITPRRIPSDAYVDVGETRSWDL